MEENDSVRANYLAIAKCDEWLAIGQTQFNCQRDLKHEGAHEVQLVTPEITAVVNWTRKEAPAAKPARKGTHLIKPKAKAKKAGKSGSGRSRKH